LLGSKLLILNRKLSTSLLSGNKELAAEKKQALKEHKKNAVATVKKHIVDYKLTKGDIRGKALKQLDM
jgi:hypothetical protein